MTPFLKGYLTAAMWTEDPSPGQGEYRGDFKRIKGESLAKALKDCETFLSSLTPRLREVCESEPEQCGHDFWLTRNRHGAGFWDRGYPEWMGEALTEAAHNMGESNAEFRNGKFYIY